MDRCTISSNTEIARHLDRLEWLAVSYLFLPVLLFFLGWLRWPFAPILSGLAAIGWALTPWKRSLARPRLSWGGVLLVLGVAGLWVAMSGLVPPFHLNDDWVGNKLSAFRDLTVGQWPVGYGSLDRAHQNLNLRFPMGFYLFPALLAKALGGSEAIGRWLLVPWTLLGVVLFAVLTFTATLPQTKPIRITHLLWLLLPREPISSGGPAFFNTLSTPRSSSGCRTMPCLAGLRGAWSGGIDSRG